MAFFAPPPIHYGPDDLGDVLFKNFTKQGRQMVADKRSVEDAQYKWMLGEEDRMKGAQGTDAYLGAVNPYDLTQRIQPYQAKTGRMGAETAAGDLKFRQDWEPNNSALRWANQGTTQQNSDTSRMAATTDQKREQFNENSYPEEMQQRWSAQGIQQQGQAAASSHAAAIEKLTADQNANDVKRTQALSDEAVNRTLTQLMGMMDPEGAKALSQLIIHRTYPDFDGRSATDKALQEAIKQRQGGGPGAANAQAAQRAASVIPGPRGQQLDSAADAEIAQKRQAERMQQAAQLRKQMETMGANNAAPASSPGFRGIPRAHTAVENRDAEVSKANMMHQIQLLESGQDLPSAGTPAPTATGGSPLSGLVPPPGTPGAQSTPVPAAGAPASPNTPQLRPGPTPTPPAAPTSGAARMNQLQDMIQRMDRSGQPIPPELLQQYQQLMSQYA